MHICIISIELGDRIGRVPQAVDTPKENTCPLCNGGRIAEERRVYGSTGDRDGGDGGGGDGAEDGSGGSYYGRRRRGALETTSAAATGRAAARWATVRRGGKDATRQLLRRDGGGARGVRREWDARRHLLSFRSVGDCTSAL